MQNRRARIAATGMYVPEKIVKNTDLEQVMDTSDEWIRQRSGIETRRHVEGQSSSDLAAEAAKDALSKAGWQPSDVDLIIVATLSPDHFFPGSSAILQAKLGLETTPSMDLRCQCSGFIYGLNVAKLFVESGQYERVLLVGAEAHSPVLDFTTRGRDVAVLFGDGAGAVLLEAAPAGSEQGILSCVLHSQGSFANRLWIEKPGTVNGTWVTNEDIEEGRTFPYMEGRYVFKHAVTRLSEVVQETLSKNDLQASDIDCFLFHQANLRINEKVADNLQLPMEKIPSNIQKYGNCSAASIPMLLHESLQTERIQPGNKVLMAAFGSGFTWAGAVVQF